MLNDTVEVADGDAVLMAQKVAASLGLGVGLSSGANLLAALTVWLRHRATAAAAPPVALPPTLFVPLGCPDQDSSQGW